MNFLFITDDLKNGEVNINLIKNLLPYLGQGHQYYFLSHTAQGTSSSFCFRFTLDEKVRQLYFSVKNENILKKMFAYLRHPVLSFLGGCKMLNIDVIAHSYKKHIEKLCKQHDIDVAVAVTAPFYTAKGLSKAKISAKKVVFMFDPYASHYIFGNKRTQKSQNAVVKKADVVFVPTLLKQEFSVYGDKVQSFEFPLIQNHTQSSSHEDKALAFTYIGSFYSDIRSPDYLYSLFQQLGFSLTVVGNVYGSFSDDFYKRHEKYIETHVNLVGLVAKEEVAQYYAQSDILINVGNMVSNQLPSKVLEYISYGKPILNFYKIDDCPSLDYFKQYPLALSIKEGDFSTETLEKIKSFCTKVKGKCLEYDFIRTTYEKGTAEFVANQFLQAIEKED